MLRAGKAARGTERVPIETTYGNMEGFKADAVTKLVLEIVESLCYADVIGTLRLFAADCRTNDICIVKNQEHSPQIIHVSWGRLEVEGRVRPYKDAKLFPGGSREWNWRETDTEHVPGIQPADVQELGDHGAEVVVLSREGWRNVSRSLVKPWSS
ncbi:MAG TPA: hypothetical protein VIS96_01200 [Terrimicrobiaceae bacterium]